MSRLKLVVSQRAGDKKEFKSEYSGSYMRIATVDYAGVYVIDADNREVELLRGTFHEVASFLVSLAGDAIKGFDELRRTSTVHKND